MTRLILALASLALLGCFEQAPRRGDGITRRPSRCRDMRFWAPLDADDGRVPPITRPLRRDDGVYGLALFERCRRPLRSPGDDAMTRR